MNNINDILSKFKIKYPLYSYKLDCYKNNKQKIEIECENKHIFSMSISQHLKGYGCPYCSGYKKSKSDILYEINKKHNFKYQYPDFNYDKLEDEIRIICDKHGEFTKSLKLHRRGVGCVKCSGRHSPDNIEFIKYCKEIDDNIDYSLTKYINNKTNVSFICTKHGLINKLPNNIKTHICDKCFNIKKNFEKFKIKAVNKYGDRFEYQDYKDNETKLKIIDKQTGFTYFQKPLYHIKCNYFYNKRTISDFIEKANKIHKNKYDYTNSIYIGNKNNIEIICKEHGSFYQIVNNHLRGAGCPKCNKFNIKENKLFEYIESIYGGEILKNVRNIISKELDIYLPHLKLAFEFNGLYWHSELFKDKNYHLNKTKDCLSNGIELIHIWEDDWENKQEIVKSIIINKLGKSYRIWARDCEIKEIGDNKLVREFLEKNHIQGFVGSKVKIGLFFNNELVSLMTFGNLRKSLGQNPKNGHFELLRFCNKLNTSVVGGASKLFKFFIKKWKVDRVISYSDNSRGVGNLYNKLGFKSINNSNINYYWIVDGIRKNRFIFRKDKLIKEGYDLSKTEVQIMKELGNFRIFDCGSKKWIYETIK
jgi:hypothetical protein